jgi:hypothetical protein
MLIGSDPTNAADLDSGQLVPLSSTPGADVAVGYAAGEVAAVKTGTGARFLLVRDTPAGYHRCKAALGEAGLSSPLLEDSDVEAGSHVCMVTTGGRLAEFEIVDVDATSSQISDRVPILSAYLEIDFTTWARE